MTQWKLGKRQCLIIPKNVISPWQGDNTGYKAVPLSGYLEKNIHQNRSSCVATLDIFTVPVLNYFKNIYKNSVNSQFRSCYLHPTEQVPFFAHTTELAEVRREGSYAKRTPLCGTSWRMLWPMSYSHKC